MASTWTSGRQTSAPPWRSEFKANTRGPTSGPPLHVAGTMSVLHRLKSLSSSSGIIMMSRLAGAGIGFLTQFLLVRLMGAHDLGLFYAGSSLAAVLGVIAAQGYPQIAARFVGRYRNKRDETLFGAFTGHAMREGLIVASILGLAVTLWSLFWPGIEMDARTTYIIAGWMIVAVASLNILTNVAGGMRAFSLCYVPEGLVRPFAFFGIIALIGILGLTLSAEAAMIIFALITGSLAIAVGILLWRQMPRVHWHGISRRGLAWRWRAEAWQLILLAIFTNFFADVGILAVVPFLSSTDVAIFGFCLKLALLVGYFVQIGQQMAVPDMADARHTGDHDRLRRAALRSIILPSAITLASMAVIYLFGDRLLALFGPDFVSGQQVLLILLAAQLLRALAGPSAHVLTLSGVQSVNMGLAVSALALLVGASAILAPALGVEGAAYAVLIAYGYWIGFSAIALRWLREPSVDVLWLAINLLRTPRLQH